MSWRKLFLVAAALGTTATVLITLPAKAEAPYGWASNLPGCDATRPAVAHHAGQQVLSPQPTDGPVPCGMLTTFPTMENRLEVTNDNTVIYSPALMGGPILSGAGHVPGWGREEGLARTFNDGRQWDGISIPVWPDLFVLDGQTDNNIYVDHNTGRLFYYMQNSGPVGINTFCGGGGGATVAWSDTDGANWNWAFDNSHNCAENPDVLSAKPTAAGATQGYPDVVYLCGDNTSSGVATTGTPGYSCAKSLTGGSRWSGTGANGTVAGPLVDKVGTAAGVTAPAQGFYSGVAKDIFDPYPQCAGKSTSADADVQPLTDGTLVVLVSCNSNFYLSESKDEGATWSIVTRIPHGGDLRIDSHNNMFLLENSAASSGNAQLLLSHSTDLGLSWSPELNMVAPGVVKVGTYEFAQGTYASGQVGDMAVTYYGSKANQSTSDGYITQTRDALDPNPIFWSGQVNSPSRPLLYNTETDGNIGLTVLDIMGGALSPDGRSVWGSFVQDCGANIVTDPSCSSKIPQTNPGDLDDGFAGRLVWPTESP
jgi:hypothetical protein